MKIVTLSDGDFYAILNALHGTDKDLAILFRESARSQVRVTNFPYFTQGGTVETSAYVARVAPPPSTSPLAKERLHHVADTETPTPVSKPANRDTETPTPVSKPANRDMWGKVRGT